MSKYVLLLPGCFNPITKMHIKLLDIAKCHISNVDTEKINGIISPVSDAYGKNYLIKAHHRVNMVKLAVNKKPWIRIDTWESNLNEKKTTLELIKSILSRDTLIQHIKLVCGSDLLETMTNPEIWDLNEIHTIIKDYGLLCVVRKGYNQNFDDTFRKLKLSNSMMKNISIIDSEHTVDISSTIVRRNIKLQNIDKFLLPEVYKYIVENELY